MHPGFRRVSLAFRAFVAHAPKDYGSELTQAKTALTQLGNEKP